MRKIYTLLLFGFISIAQAQVPNANFEQAFGYGQTDVANWGRFFIIPISFDLETGETQSDDIIFDPESISIGTFCTSVTDAQAGEKAMMIRNAFNVTRNEVIVGRADLFNSDISELPTGWNAGIPVEANASINSLGFWYKFYPLGNDAAEAKLELFDTNGVSIGTAKITIAAADEYTYAAVPITFTSIESPAFMTITFTMEADNTTAVFGSYLLIDSLSVNNALLQTNAFETSDFTLFPTSANNEINLRSAGGTYTIAIYNTQGRLVSQSHVELQNGISKPINVSLLANGIYLLKAENNSTAITKKFIKK